VEKMRLKSLDNYLITVMSALALVCLYKLYGTKLVNFNSESELKVASIVEQLKIVKRKKDFYQGWMDVRPGDGLSQNDEIYTHEQSSAHIKFTNGPDISLFENSLLRIKSAKLGSTLSLDKGNMIAKLSPESPKLDIELNGKKYSFNSQNADIQIEQGKTENKFLLLNGKAKLSGQEILQNQVVIQNIKTGELKIKEIPFIPKLPLNNHSQYYLQEADLNFSWVYTNQSVPVKIIIARDSDFTKIASQENLEGNTYQVTLTDPGTYYWKLTSSDLIDGPIKSFSLIKEVAPIVHFDQTIFYRGPKSAENFFLNWSKNNAKKYLVKIESPNGKSEEVTTNKASYDFTPTIIGHYSISVKVSDENRPLALWSERAMISLNEAREINITSVTPELIEKVNYNNQASSYILSWNGPVDGVNYKIKLIKDNKTMDLETDQTSIPLTLKEPGTYNWEVVGTTKSGVTSNKISGKIIIKAPLHLTQLPSEGAVVELEKPDQLVAFKWDKVEEAIQYQFELSNEPTFKKILVTRDVDANNISTSLAEIGKYYWRVKIKRGSNIEYSNPVSVEIRPAPPLTRPEVSPDIKIKLKYLDEKSSSFNLIDLLISKVQAADQIAIAEWDLPANTKAKSYFVEIYKDPDLNILITKIETEVPHVVWKNATAGKFYWRVSYMDFWGRRTEFSSVSVLSTEDQEIAKPVPVEIELQNPKHHADVLKEESDLLTFKWASIPEAKSYQVLIARDLEFENIILKKSSSQNELKVSCTEFDNRSGNYFWKITSGENTSKRRQLRVICAPPPPPVKVEKTAPVVVVVEKSNEKEIVIKEETLKDHFLRLGFFPHHITYQNMASKYSAKVDGNALNSWFVTYQRPLDLNYFQIISPTMFISRGKVFNDITFMDMELNLKVTRKQTSFSWGPVAALMKKTLYVESNQSIAEESVSSPLLGLFFQKESDSFTMNAEVKLGTILDYHGDIQYRVRNNFAIGIFFDSSSITKDDNKHTFVRYGLNLNYTFNFLDTVK
jgi:hypothetical protein